MKSESVAAGDDVSNTRVKVWLTRPVRSPGRTSTTHLFPPIVLLTHRFISALIPFSDKLVSNSVEMISMSFESAT